MISTITRSTNTIAFYASGTLQGSNVNASVSNNADNQAGGFSVSNATFSGTGVIGEAYLFNTVSGGGGALSSGDRASIFGAGSTYWGAN